MSNISQSMSLLSSHLESFSIFLFELSMIMLISTIVKIYKYISKQKKDSNINISLNFF